ncbi:MAG: T9SS type A sorting domain-containing protein [Saprospiraceae bacterium]|nr:T9SS type A sorting domain-containing protein [Saprospiraceae bacterium]
MRKQCIAGVTSRAKESMEWDVFHSPSEDQIEIHWYQSSNQISAGSPVFRIYNVQGVVIKEITGKSEYDIFVPSRSLANGIYYVQMTYDHQTEIKSFFKAN